MNPCTEKKAIAESYFNVKEVNANDADCADLRREEMARRLRRFAQNDLNADDADLRG
ncbi:hypothetical protein [Draconibacterium sp.]|uniref:hypothetical protein n=1 Tax=Draconibacterium sp. TaxID=1965318 RepID=UPI00356558B4